VKRVRDDLGEPDEPGLHIPQEEQMYGTEEQAAETHGQPDLADLMDELRGRRVRMEKADPRRIDPKDGG